MGREDEPAVHPEVVAIGMQECSVERPRPFLRPWGRQECGGGGRRVAATVLLSLSCCLVSLHLTHGQRAL